MMINTNMEAIQAAEMFAESSARQFRLARLTVQGKKVPPRQDMLDLASQPGKGVAAVHPIQDEADAEESLNYARKSYQNEPMLALATQANMNHDLALALLE